MFDLTRQNFSTADKTNVDVVFIRHHRLLLYPLREIVPCVLSLQASRSFAQLPASVQPLNPSSPRSHSTVLHHVSFGLPHARLPSGVHVKAILVVSFTHFLSTRPISFQRLRFICWVISFIMIFVFNLISSFEVFISFNLNLSVLPSFLPDLRIDSNDCAKFLTSVNLSVPSPWVSACEMSIQRVQLRIGRSEIHQGTGAS